MLSAYSQDRVKFHVQTYYHHMINVEVEKHKLIGRKQPRKESHDDLHRGQTIPNSVQLIFLENK